MSLDYIDPTTPPPVDWTGGVFPEPMLYRMAPLWVFLLLLAVLGLLFYRQRLLDLRSDGRRAPAIIFKEIRTAIDRALYATGPATIPAGQKVVETIKLYLGPVLAFSSDLKGQLGRLEKAIEGKAEDGLPKKEPHDPAKAEARHGAVVVTTTGQEGAVTADKFVQVVGPAQIVTVTEAPRHEPHDGGRDKHDHENVMSVHEQTAAVRYALERLHELWTVNTMEPRLKAMQEALSIREAKGARLGRDPYRRPLEDAPRRRSTAAAAPKL